MRTSHRITASKSLLSFPSNFNISFSKFMICSLLLLHTHNTPNLVSPLGVAYMFLYGDTKDFDNLSCVSTLEDTDSSSLSSHQPPIAPVVHEPLPPPAWNGDWLDPVLITNHSCSEYTRPPILSHLEDPCSLWSSSLVAPESWGWGLR